MTRRRKRRNRHRLKRAKAIADVTTLEAIHKSYLWASATWGGTRCPGCGLGVRPHWLRNLSHSGPGYHITGFANACKHIKDCPGERDWEEAAAERMLRKAKS